MNAGVTLYGLYDQRPGASRAAPIYVGIGTPKRMRSHIALAKTRFHVNPGLYGAILEHRALGLDLDFRTLAVCNDHKHAAICEKRAIRIWGRRTDPKPGPLLNLSPGNGAGAKGSSPEYRAQQSAANRIKLHRPETRAKHLAALDRIAKTVDHAAKGPKMARHIRETPGELERRVGYLDAARKDPELMARRAAKAATTMKASWAAPEIRAKRVAALKGVKKTLSQASINARRNNAKIAQAKRLARKVEEK